MSVPDSDGAARLSELEISVVVIGAGFGGICMAIRLKRAGIPFVVLEKADSVGGVWRDNTYPGAACDVPSHLYSFSFEPSADWSRTFGAQPEINSYIEHCAHRYGIAEHIRFGVEVVAAEFDEHAGRWGIELNTGDRIETRFLVAATGQLSRPAYPKIPGLDEFNGSVFHSARWDHGVDLEGKRVAVIGTGASAIQFVPEIVSRVGHLDLYQRSAPYVLPKRDRGYSRLEKFLFGRLPALQAANRTKMYAQHEARAITLTHGFGANLVGRRAKRHLAREVRDPDLRRRLTPDYPVGCKRVLISNHWYPAVAKDNVQVLGVDIEEVRDGQIIGADGTERATDVIILGTGFQANDFLAPIDLVGRHGRKLSDAWKDGADAYLGLTVSGFPNFFMLYGPNTNLGHNSIIYMLERQAEYALAAIRQVGVHGRTFADLRSDVQERFNAEIQSSLESTVWEAGCTSWYRTASGKNTNNWPGFTFDYAKRTQYFDPGHYDMVKPARTGQGESNSSVSMNSNEDRGSNEDGRVPNRGSAQ